MKDLVDMGDARLGYKNRYITAGDGSQHGPRRLRFDALNCGPMSARMSRTMESI